jgi:hypothetical protein
VQFKRFRAPLEVGEHACGEIEEEKSEGHEMFGLIVDAVIDWFLTWRYWFRDELLKVDPGKPDPKK